MAAWRRVLLGVLALLAVDADASPGQAGAFTLEPGETKLFVTNVLNAGDHYFDEDGRLRRRESYRKLDMQIYAERGLRDGLTAFAAVGLQRIRAKDRGTYQHEGLGRTEAGLRQRVFQSHGWIASVQASAVIAGAKKGPSVAVVGETDDQFDGRALIAKSFEAFGRPAFVDLAAGYRKRTGDPADELRFDATLGVRVMPRLLLMAQSFNTIGTGRWTGPYALKQRIHKLQGAAMYDLDERWSLVGAAFFTPAGRDALDETGGTLGVALRY